MSPRTFREYRENEDLCDDAEAFHDEAMRRVKAVIAKGGDPGAGDRIRIIGYDELLEEPEFEGFPRDLLTIPGETIAEVDGEDRSDVFSAFVHAPYKDDSYGDRNDCSLAFQISLYSGEGVGQGATDGRPEVPDYQTYLRPQRRRSVGMERLAGAASLLEVGDVLAGRGRR